MLYIEKRSLDLEFANATPVTRLLVHLVEETTNSLRQASPLRREPISKSRQRLSLTSRVNVRRDTIDILLAYPQLRMIDFMQDKASDDIGPAVYSRQLTLGC